MEEKLSHLLFILFSTFLLVKCNGAEDNVNWENAKSVYDFEVKDIEGNTIKLDKYKGQVLIIVNVASYCGYTEGHYTGLNKLYEKYHDKGLDILAFPCNQFGYQEPGTDEEICTFAKSKEAKFDMFAKINVNGNDAHPLFNYLKQKQHGTLGDFIKWNFTKFIIDKHGQPVMRYGPNVDPLELEDILIDLLKQDDDESRSNFNSEL